MKKAISLLLAIAMCLSLCSCDLDLELGILDKLGVSPTEYLVACFGCKQEFTVGQLNADFGLCQDCLMDVGAAYCKKCDAPCYTRDMIQGLCQTCSASESTETTTQTTVSQTNGDPESVACNLCGASYHPSEITDGYCPGCYAQASYDENDEAEYYACDSCGREYDSADELYDGLCYGCYCDKYSLCISCGTRPDEGYGPSGMECSECYYRDYATCAGCGYDYWKDDMYGEYCSSCGVDPLPGTYYANYENVKITISYIDYEHYLTYTDLTSGITLYNIPLSYCNAYTATEKMLMFQIDSYYPEYSGYVEFCLFIGARAEYSYNALIDGLEDTDGYYSSLTKQ